MGRQFAQSRKIHALVPRRMNLSTLCKLPVNLKQGLLAFIS